MKIRVLNRRKIIGTVGAVVALIISIVYFVVVPTEAYATTGFQMFILMYAHSLCWVLLSAASFIWGWGIGPSGSSRNNKWSGYLAYGALAVYVVFMATLLLNK